MGDKDEAYSASEEDDGLEGEANTVLLDELELRHLIELQRMAQKEAQKREVRSRLVSDSWNYSNNFSVGFFG